MSDHRCNKRLRLFCFRVCSSVSVLSVVVALRPLIIYNYSAYKKKPKRKDPEKHSIGLHYSPCHMIFVQ